jgi:hypothetical protein
MHLMASLANHWGEVEGLMAACTSQATLTSRTKGLKERGGRLSEVEMDQLAGSRGPRVLGARSFARLASQRRFGCLGMAVLAVPPSLHLRQRLCEMCVLLAAAAGMLRGWNFDTTFILTWSGSTSLENIEYPVPLYSAFACVFPRSICELPQRQQPRQSSSFCPLPPRCAPSIYPLAR